MYAFLKGTVERKAADHIELNVNGVGYEIHVPNSVYARIAPNQGVTLLTYCHIREDAFQIFGFLREDEKALFKSLLGVTGVGPRVALAILSVMSPSEFGRVVLESDVDAFKKVSGVGKKSGQRIVLEMKAKLGQDAELEAILGEPTVAANTASAGDDVVAALTSLGCTMAEAKQAASRARGELGEDAPDEELVKVALRSMAKV